MKGIDVGRDPKTGLVDGEYDRPKNEYAKPPRAIDISSLDSDFFNVAGADLHADRLPPVNSRRFAVSLVPEPGNPWDSTALCIERKGLRIGYAPRKLASTLHHDVKYLNSLGLEVVSKARFVSENDWSPGRPVVEVLFPIRWFHEFFADIAGSFDLNKAALACMPTESLQHVLKYLKYGDQDFMDPVPKGLIDHLFQVRERIAATLDERYPLNLDREWVEMGRPYRTSLRLAVSSEAFRERRVEAASREVRKRISIELVGRKYTRVAVGKLVGVKPPTVTRYLKEHQGAVASPSDKELKLEPLAAIRGISAPKLISAIGRALESRDWPSEKFPLHRLDGGLSNFGMLTYLESCEFAELMIRFGVTKSTVARVLKCEESSISNLLEDLSFYQDPSSDLDRMDRVHDLRRVLNSGKWSQLTDREACKLFQDHTSLHVLKMRFGRHPIFAIADAVSPLLDS